MSLSLEINKQDLQKILKKFNALSVKDKSGIIFKAFVKAGAILTNRLKRNSGGEILKARSGFLRDSIQFKTEEKEDQITTTVGSCVISGKRMTYANIHENGGTIRPINKRFLAIPLPLARQPNQTAKFTPTQLRNGQASGYRGSFIMNHIIFGVTGGKNYFNQKIIPLFALRISVNIKPTHYMSKTITQCNNQVVTEFINTLEKAVNT
jgi:hypothetical protein